MRSMCLIPVPWTGQERPTSFPTSSQMYCPLSMRRSEAERKRQLASSLNLQGCRVPPSSTTSALWSRQARFLPWESSEVPNVATGGSLTLRQNLDDPDTDITERHGEADDNGDDETQHARPRNSWSRRATSLATSGSTLTKRGIEQVVDLHKNDQKFRDYNGAKLAAGWLHCPGTPDRLGDIPQPGPTATDVQKEEFYNRIDERRPYALRRIAITPLRRFQCPALAGTVGCPLRAGTVEGAVEGNLPIITNPPAADSAPTCCTQATVTLGQDGQRKIWQQDYWGDRDWSRSNNRRTYVEGSFGNMKNPSTENLSRGTFRITGLARVTLFLGVLAAAHNVRQYRNWHQKHQLGDPTDPLLAPDSQTIVTHLSPEEYSAYEQWRAANPPTAA